MRKDGLRVLVIDCDESLQVSRTMKRSGLSAEAVRAIMAAQLSRQERLARADDVLRNDTDIADLRRQVAMVLQPPLVFPCSIRDNIAYGRPEASDAEVAAAARLACIDRFVAQSPGGGHRHRRALLSQTFHRCQEDHPP